VELDKRTSRARVVELPAHLETHGSLPTVLAYTPSSRSLATRQLKCIYAERYSWVLRTLHSVHDIPAGYTLRCEYSVPNQSWE
ncbi:hypothetical protein K435DRAFT_972062, partial [Dendrothele bispora CBS 962.96]